MIIFNTEGQAVNWLKRTKRKGHHYSEGCGCCWNSSSYSVDTKTRKVLYLSTGSHQGNMYADITVLGRIKN